MENSQKIHILNRIRLAHPKQLTQLANFLLTSGEDWVLLWIRSQNKKIFAIDITEHFGLTPGRVANIIKKLEERGFIERQQYFGDLRKACINLTESGFSHAETLYKNMNGSHAQFINDLDEKDSTQVIQILQKIITLMENGMQLGTLK